MWLSEEERATLEDMAKRAGYDTITAFLKAAIAADAVNGVPFQDSVRKASLFIKKCIEKSIEMDLPLTDGVCFEEILYQLK